MKQPKVAVEISKENVRKQKAGRLARQRHGRPINVKFVRRESNEEIIHRSILERGFVRLRLQLQILHAGGSYVGYQGSGICVECDNLKSAKELVQHVRQSIREQAAKLGMSTREMQVSEAN